MREKRVYDFGRFRLDADNHELLRDGRTVPLKPKAFDTLLLLVESDGRVVAKEELLRRLWPDSIVEEASLTQNIYELRKALADPSREHSFIENLPKRGYRFVAEVSAPTKRYTDSAEAYNLYLKGRYNWNKVTEEGLRKAIHFFEAAVAVDPRYALAWVGISDAYTSLDWYGVLSTRESNPLADAAARKALEIDDGLAEAHASLAMARQYAWDWEGAESEYRKAIALNPDYPPGRQWYGVFLAFMGRFDEALTHVRRAQELDPVSLAIGSQVSLVLLFARRYSEAAAQARQVLDVDSASVEARFYLAMTHVLQGHIAEAIEIYCGLPAENPDFRAMLAHAYGISGQVREARAILSELTSTTSGRYVPPFWLAMAHLGLGEHEQALGCIEHACDDPDDSLLAVRVFPMLDPLRRSSRFVEILRRMRLDDVQV